MGNLGPDCREGGGSAPLSPPLKTSRIKSTLDVLEINKFHREKKTEFFITYYVLNISIIFYLIITCWVEPIILCVKEVLTNFSYLFYQMYQYFLVLQCDMFKAFVYFNNSCKLDFFLQQRYGLLHTCATWSRLPSTINTLGCFVDRTVIYILHQVGRMTKLPETGLNVIIFFDINLCISPSFEFCYQILFWFDRVLWKIFLFIYYG